MKQFRSILDQTEVLRFPRHRLATFGDTEIPYQLVTPHPEDARRALLRTGLVKALRPKILTAETLLRHFEGFGEDADGFERMLRDHFGDMLRGLEYSFHNRLDETVAHSRDARAVAESVRDDLDSRDQPRTAVILGPESGWSLALMKFTLEETGRSFPGQMRELDERGMFDPAGTALRRRRAEVENLFKAAAADPSLLSGLAAKLKQYGLFDEYQDRFFALVK